jgi:hypothetical protein
MLSSRQQLGQGVSQVGGSELTSDKDKGRRVGPTGGVGPKFGLRIERRGLVLLASDRWLRLWRHSAGVHQEGEEEWYSRFCQETEAGRSSKTPL